VDLKLLKKGKYIFVYVHLPLGNQTDTQLILNNGKKVSTQPYYRNSFQLNNKIDAKMAILLPE
jgi:hypothetical protein